MLSSVVELLRCPQCHAPLLHRPPGGGDGRGGEALECPAGHSYPVVGGVPRFVETENYADSFGFQWNRFRKTQLDSVTGQPISRARFERFTGWSAEMLAGKLVLDVGCGAGRFAEVALALGATVVALDYSTAVDACYANLGAHPRLTVLQADIYTMPFRPEAFDFVYCLGVLQHTPDVARAFHALPRLVKSGGQLAVDLYPKLPLNLFWPKYWLRPLTKRISKPRLFGIVERMAPKLLPLSDLLRRIPFTRGRLRYLVPVVNYRGVFPLTDAQLREWAVLDTFDMLSPAFDSPQSAGTLRRWFEEAGLRNVTVERVGFLVGRGTKA